MKKYSLLVSYLSFSMSIFGKKIEESVDLEKKMNYIDSLDYTEDKNRILKECLEETHEKACEGDSKAQFNIGYCFQNGLGVEKDYIQAEEWYKLAVKQEDKNAQNNWAVLFIEKQNYQEALKLLESAISQGHIEACNNLGVLFQGGMGVEKNYKTAFKYYARAAKKGSFTAMYHLGYLYEHGLGVKKDYAQAVKFYIKAAKNGNPDAQYNLSYLYEHGIFVSQDQDIAKELLILAAKNGSPEAQNVFGVFFVEGYQVENDFYRAFNYFKLASEQGNIDAYNNLGVLYQAGLGVKQNYTEAYRLFKYAVDNGNVEALKHLAYLFEKGLGVTQDSPKALDLYNTAATKGNVDAENHLGDYFISEGGIKGIKIAQTWYESAADKGSAEGICNFALFYLGLDDRKAFNLFERAANKGSVIAQNNVGYCYQQGIGIGQNDQEAHKWFEMAAKNNCCEAQFNLSWAYYKGLGVDASIKNAIDWMKRAADQGDNIAEFCVGILSLIDCCQNYLLLDNNDKRNKAINQIQESYENIQKNLKQVMVTSGLRDIAIINDLVRDFELNVEKIKSKGFLAHLINTFR